jgi:hypothetical protein
MLAARDRTDLDTPGNRTNADLHMAEDLKTTGNLFVILGELDIDLITEKDGMRPRRTANSNKHRRSREADVFSKQEFGTSEQDARAGPGLSRPRNPAHFMLSKMLTKREREVTALILRVKVNGVDVFNPQTGGVISDDADGIACWFIDALGADDPYSGAQDDAEGRDRPRGLGHAAQGRRECERGQRICFWPEQRAALGSGNHHRWQLIGSGFCGTTVPYRRTTTCTTSRSSGRCAVTG